MALPADYHTHTPLCRHATGEPTELAAQALKMGLKEIGFSDHNPMPRDDFDDWRMKLSELDDYVARVEQARRDHPNSPSSSRSKWTTCPDTRTGFETWRRGIRGTISSAPSITSRTLGPSTIPAAISEWEKRDPLEVWTAYFERLTMAADSGLFDIIGHVDLCKKFRIYPQADCTPLFQNFLQAAKRRGVAIELNTAGLRKDCKEIYPSPRIVHLAAQLGVPITFGSDAHAPKEVGLHFAEAVQLAHSAGYTHYCRFTRRKREEVKL